MTDMKYKYKIITALERLVKNIGVFLSHFHTRDGFVLSILYILQELAYLGFRYCHFCHTCSYIFILRSTTTVFHALSVVKLDRVLIVSIIHVHMQVSC